MDHTKENTIIEPEVVKPKKAKKSILPKKWTEFLDSKELTNNTLIAIVFFSLASGIYIYLIHKHVKVLNNIQTYKTENQELRSELIAIQSDLMKKSKQSQVAHRVAPLGLFEMRKPPLKLIDNSKK